MKLLTKELEAQLIKAYQDDPVGDTPLEDQMVLAKFFYPAGHATWFLTCMDPEDRRIMTWAKLQPGCGEWGWSSLDEIEAFVGSRGLKIERDLYFKQEKVKDCKELQRYMKGE